MALSGPAAAPWVEKYRPRKVQDVAHQQEVVAALTTALQTGNLPHLLFYGPPGTGKTTTALAVGRQLYGPELVKARVLELNASDERGISVVRGKIKSFASQVVKETAPGYPCPPFKLLILDEADSMTADAQNALRRTMEQYSRVTRFAFCCNYVSRIIEPIASRCAKFRFKPVDQGAMADRLRYICGEEGVALEDGSDETLRRVSGGDMRKAITLMQSAARLHGSVTPAGVESVGCTVPEDRIDALVAACRTGPFDKAAIQCEALVLDGYPGAQVLSQLAAKIVADADIKDAQKARMLPFMATADKCLVDGADETLQLMNVASKCVEAMG